MAWRTSEYILPDLRNRCHNRLKAAGMAGICACGRPVQGRIGRLCGICLAVRSGLRAQRRADKNIGTERDRRGAKGAAVPYTDPALPVPASTGREGTSRRGTGGTVLRPGESPGAHLKWIRSMNCCVKGCTGRPIHAHHVRIRSGSGTGLKPGAEWTVPLCQSHHAALHLVGAQTFNERHGVNLRALAYDLAKRSPHLTERRQE